MNPTLRQSLRTIHRLVSNLVRSPHPDPIIITGLQKSGTSAIAGLLSHCSGLKATIDVFCRMGNYETRLIDGQVSFEQFIRDARCYFANPIVKEPEFVLFLDALFAHYPTGRKVFVAREPFDNIRSILNRLKIPGNLNRLPEQHTKRISDQCSLWLPLIKEDEKNNYIDTLAKRWAFSIESYYKRQDSFLLVKYEDFVQNKEGFIKKLAQDLGLPTNHSIESVKDKQFQPAGKRENANAFFGEANAKKIALICGELSRSLNYSLPALG